MLLQHHQKQLPPLDSSLSQFHSHPILKFALALRCCRKTKDLSENFIFVKFTFVEEIDHSFSTSQTGLLISKRRRSVLCCDRFLRELKVSDWCSLSAEGVFRYTCKERSCVTPFIYYFLQSIFTSTSIWCCSI
jgi:hypothetical protein